MNEQTILNSQVLTPTKKQRLLFVDNIRWLMIIFVVIMHANVTYSNMGRWYYVEQRNYGLISKALFGMYGSFTQAYFLGLMFFIAGYFIPNSFDKKGPVKFVKDRLIRLGIPTLFYMLIISPFINYFIMGSFWTGKKPSFGDFYSHYLKTFSFVGESGPLWFAFALLLFTLVYVLFRLSGVLKLKSEVNAPTPKSRHIIILAALTSVVTFLIRLVQPIGTAILNLQFCFFTLYIVLFALGIIAYRKNWLINFSYSVGVLWFKLSLLIGIPFWLILEVFGGGRDGSRSYTLNGGLNWQAAAFALWESFFCFGVCIGLIVIFRKKFNKMNRFTSFLSDNAFAVFVFHAPILITISLLAKNIYILPYIKFLLVCAITIPVCFVFAYLIRLIPGVKRIF